MKKFILYILIPAIVIMGFVFAPKYLTKDDSKVQEVKNNSFQYSEIITLIKENKISEINLNTSSGKLKYKLRESGKIETYYLSNPDYFHSDISNYINENNINNVNDESKIIKVNYSSSLPLKTIIALIPSLLSFVIIIVVGKKILKMTNSKTSASGNKQDLLFGMKSRAKSSKSGIKFTDVAGAEEEKEELAEIVEYLKNPKIYSEAGARVPKGVLLVGPPGTGKTLLARAVAGETDVPFFSTSGSDFVEMFVGVGASRVRALFEQAKKVAPSIIFIDEIDAIGGKREGSRKSGSNDEQEQTLNQLLVEMDGFSKSENIIVIAATNRPDVLDPALLRPGRFDRQVAVNLPDIKGREQILKIHGRNKKFDTSVDFKKIASATVGFSGADIENLLNEAALRTIKECRKEITQDDINESMIKVVMGAEKKSLVINDKDKKITAYHEAGHAIVSYFLKTQDNVEQISIIPRGMAAGHTLFKPKTDNSHVAKEYLCDQICVLLGGRVAEDISQCDTSTGASNDIKKATKIARKMLTEWGMDGKVSLSYKDISECSEETKRIIDSKIDDILSSSYDKARDILLNNKRKLDEIAKNLCQKEKISGEEFRLMMSET